MIKLHTFGIVQLTESTIEKPIVSRITTNKSLPEIMRKNEILLVKDNSPKYLPDGFLAYFLLNQSSRVENPFAQTRKNIYILPSDQSHLSNGDIVKFDPNKLSLRAIYRKASSHNSLLVTEQCNNYCLMCSQPPKRINDDYIIDELLQAIPLMDDSTKELGITGGEPTIIGDRLLDILKYCKSYLPRTAIHILSNGRSFSELENAKKIASLGMQDLMIGIPIYSDIFSIHDYVVQTKGAFDETIKGIINLKRYGIAVEIRIVIHQQTYKRLPQFAEFLTRNLLFVDHVAFMGLEMVGFARANKDILEIDPAGYSSYLSDAVNKLAHFKMNVSIYNHPLCTIDRKIWKYNRKSISDWKNSYASECNQCILKEQCGGFFSTSSSPISKFIKPFLNIDSLDALQVGCI